MHQPGGLLGLIAWHKNVKSMGKVQKVDISKRDPRCPHLNKIKVKETVDTVKLRPPIYLKVAKLTCKTKILYPFLKYEQVTHYCLPSNNEITQKVS